MKEYKPKKNNTFKKIISGLLITAGIGGALGGAGAPVMDNYLRTKIPHKIEETLKQPEYSRLIRDRLREATQEIIRQEIENKKTTGKISEKVALKRIMQNPEQYATDEANYQIARIFANNEITPKSYPPVEKGLIQAVQLSKHRNQLDYRGAPLVWFSIKKGSDGYEATNIKINENNPYVGEIRESVETALKQGAIRDGIGRLEGIARGIGFAFIMLPILMVSINLTGFSILSNSASTHINPLSIAMFFTGLLLLILSRKT